MEASRNHSSRSVHGTPSAIARDGRDPDRGIVQSHLELSDAFARSPPPSSALPQRLPRRIRGYGAVRAGAGGSALAGWTTWAPQEQAGGHAGCADVEP